MILVAIIQARADEPLPPPADHTAYSQNRKYSAFFSVAGNKTVVNRLEKVRGKTQKIKLWEMTGWQRNAYLSNTGENLVVAYEGANLLDLDYKPDQVMLSFYERGNLVSQVRLNQLIENPSADRLVKTVSHYQWCSTYGLNTKQLFEVNTIQNKQFLFNLKTGQPVNTTLYAAAFQSDKLPLNSTTTNSNDSLTVQTASSPAATPAQENRTSCFATVIGLVGGILLFYASMGLA